MLFPNEKHGRRNPKSLYCSFSLAMYIFSSLLTFHRVPNSAAPSGPPENFEVRPLRGKGTAVTATWDPPDEPNGKIRGETYNALLIII